MFRVFGWSFAVTAVVFVAAFALGGPEVLGLVAILSVLEISLSFDNAVVNATVLQRMSGWWQKIFLTVGVLIAVFGMRLIFPLLIVAVTAGLSPSEAFQLAINDPDQYAAELTSAHPAIAAYGGIFLAMIFLDFVLESRELTWLSWIERPLAKLGAVEALSSVIALTGLVLAAEKLSPENAQTILVAGIFGLITYLMVNGLAGFFEVEADPDDREIAGISGLASAAQGAMATGKAAFFLFMYLEVLDASFSFDGVIGAFAITSNIFIIAAGLGVGAMYIRSLTVYLVRQGTLDEYVYLEHGAHYAIGALAILLFFSVRYEIPDMVTGLIGVGFIALAFLSSVLRNRSEASLTGDPQDPVPTAA